MKFPLDLSESRGHCHFHGTALNLGCIVMEFPLDLPESRGHCHEVSIRPL